jgi:ubiquinone/menaquinone biosynthesis C-methylase UbiE
MRNYLYKLIIDDVTDHCYRNSLEYFPKNSRILDVGIGNGLMIKKYHDLIKSKDLQIVGIDINKSYLNHCNSLINKWDLDEHISIFHAPVECYEPPERNHFDFILFSMSFMLFENQELVLDRVRHWLKPSGKVLFFQTMFRKKSPFIEFIKPRLKYFTTIDFGRITYDEEFLSMLKRKKVSVDEDRLIKKEWFSGEYRLIISTPENGTQKKVQSIQPEKRKEFTRAKKVAGLSGKSISIEN